MLCFKWWSLVVCFSYNWIKAASFPSNSYKMQKMTLFWEVKHAHNVLQMPSTFWCISWINGGLDSIENTLQREIWPEFFSTYWASKRVFSIVVWKVLYFHVTRQCTHFTPCAYCWNLQCISLLNESLKKTSFVFCNVATIWCIKSLAWRSKRYKL